MKGLKSSNHILVELEIIKNQYQVLRLGNKVPKIYSKNEWEIQFLTTAADIQVEEALRMLLEKYFLEEQ